MIHRLKHNFTAGEISPLTSKLVDFSRFKNGCHRLENMIPLTQGPVTRRVGFEFIYDLTLLGLDLNHLKVVQIPFTHDEELEYNLILFNHVSGTPRLVVAIAGGLVVYPDPPPTECPAGTPISPPVSAGDVVYIDLPNFEIDKLDYAQSGDELFIAQPGLQPHVLTRYSHYCWTLSSVTFANQPTDWSTTNGWPETVVFFQQRLLFACNTLRPHTVWASKAGDYLNFTTGTNDDDALTFTLDSGTQNKIMWLAAKKALNIGTLGNEWTVTGATSHAITPTNILAKLQSNRGSSKVKPLSVNFTTIFTERFGRTVEEFIYDYMFDSYKTVDMSVLAPHITEKFSLIDWAYQQVPHSIIWMVRSDGELIGLTYQREQKVVGWHRHPSDAVMMSVNCTSSKTRREDELWVIVKRTIDGNEKIYLEKKAAEFISDDAIDSVFLDSYSVFSGASVNVIHGLYHLEGKTVSILADGATHPDRVVSSGTVELNNFYSHIVIGLPYKSVVEPVLQELNVETGTSVGRYEGIAYLDLSLYRSLGCKIGRCDSEDGDYEEVIPFRRPYDKTGSRLPLFSGVKHVNYPESYDRDARYYISQEQPLPLTILAITDIFEMED